MEDIVHQDHISQETGLKRSVEGLMARRKLLVVQVMMQDWDPSNQLIVNGEISTPWLAKRGRVFGLIINVCIIGSFQSTPHYIGKGNASYPPPCAKVDHHVGKSLDSQLQVKGHGWSLRFFGVKEAILKEHLACKVLDVIPGCFSPIVNTP
jgi:hypothetical protein